MGVPKNGGLFKFISWNTPFFHGWFLGVPPWLRKPPHRYANSGPEIPRKLRRHRAFPVNPSPKPRFHRTNNQDAAKLYQQRNGSFLPRFGKDKSCNLMAPKIWESRSEFFNTSKPSEIWPAKLQQFDQAKDSQFQWPMSFSTEIG